jgi:putative membrane protein
VLLAAKASLPAAQKPNGKSDWEEKVHGRLLFDQDQCADFLQVVVPMAQAMLPDRQRRSAMRRTLLNFILVSLASVFSVSSAWADSSIAAPDGPSGSDWSHYGHGQWMMEGWGGMPMMGWGSYDSGGWIMMLLVGLVVIALAVLVFRTFIWSAHPSRLYVQPQHGSPVGPHALDERYARGEINREECLQKKRDIIG